MKLQSKLFDMVTWVIEEDIHRVGSSCHRFSVFALVRLFTCEVRWVLKASVNVPLNSYCRLTKREVILFDSGLSEEPFLLLGEFQQEGQTISEAALPGPGSKRILPPCERYPHHHHVVLSVRISPTLFYHPFLSSIVSDRSLGLHHVSA